VVKRAPWVPIWVLCHPAHQRFVRLFSSAVIGSNSSPRARLSSERDKSRALQADIRRQPAYQGSTRNGPCPCRYFQRCLRRRCRRMCSFCKPSRSRPGQPGFPRRTLMQYSLRSFAFSKPRSPKMATSLAIPFNVWTLCSIPEIGIPISAALPSLAMPKRASKPRFHQSGRPTRGGGATAPVAALLAAAKVAAKPCMPITAGFIGARRLPNQAATLLLPRCA